jgi:hypothetical protein
MQTRGILTQRQHCCCCCCHHLNYLQVRGYRSAELSALALRKYLDALCVYFWAATQLLLSGTTFGLMVLLGQPLR